MARLDGLGDDFLIVPNSSGRWIPLRDASAATFACYAAAGNQTITIQEATDADGTGAQNLAVIERLWKGDLRSTTWTEVTQTASHTYTHADATNEATVLTIRANQLSAGHTHIAATTTNTATSRAFLHGLHSKKSPASYAQLLAPLDPGNALLLNGLAWWSPSGITSGMVSWSDEIGAARFALGSDETAEATDPTVTLGSPNGLTADGTNDICTLLDTSGVLPTFANQSGSYSFLFHGLWDSSIAAGEVVASLQEVGGLTPMILLRALSTTQVQIQLRNDTSTTITTLPSGTLTNGERYTIACVVDDATTTGYLINENGTVTSDSDITPTGTYTFSAAYLFAITAGASLWSPGTVHDVALSGAAWTQANLSTIHNYLVGVT